MSTDSPSDSRNDFLELMRHHGITPETRLFRATLSRFLSESPEGQELHISANEHPSEAVIDIYSQGHICLAEQVGAGLAFAENADNQWIEEDRVVVELEVGDVLEQGGCLYPVESVITEKVWYATLPSGKVRVRRCP